MTTISSSLSSWVIAIRPITLMASMAPVFVGTAAAAKYAGEFNVIIFLATLFAAIFIQIGTNFANDAFDFEKGADNSNRLGPIRATHSGLISLRKMKLAALLAFCISVAIGLYLVIVGGWPILLIGCVSIVAGIIYTGGPWPIGYHSLGDVFVFVFFGLIAVVGCYYLQSKEISNLAVILGATVGFIAMAILSINNLRDLESDKLSGKITIAVKLGQKITRMNYSLLMITPYFLVIVIAVVWSHWWVMLSLLSIPVSIYFVSSVLGGRSGAQLNGALKGTALVHLIFSTLLSGGLLL